MNNHFCIIRSMVADDVPNKLLIVLFYHVCLRPQNFKPTKSGDLRLRDKIIIEGSRSLLERNRFIKGFLVSLFRWPNVFLSRVSQGGGCMQDWSSGIVSASGQRYFFVRCFPYSVLLLLFSIHHLWCFCFLSRSLPRYWLWASRFWICVHLECPVIYKWSRNVG